MKNKSSAFVFSGIALLLAIPAIILAASFASMLKTGDTATTLALRSDTTFYAYKNIKILFTRTACNAVKTYGTNTTLVASHMNDRFKPHILSIFSSGAGFNVSFGGDFNATYLAANNRVRVGYSSNTSRGVSVTVTDLSAMTNDTGELGPEEYPLDCEYEIKQTPPPARDTTPPVVTINYPGNRTYCPDPTGPTVNVTVNIGVDEPTRWIKYCIASPASAACGVNKTYNATAEEILAVNNTYRLDAYANDTSGNIGSASVYFLGTTFFYVSSYTNTTGNVINFNNAKSATDAGAFANITEATGFNVTLQPPNRDFSTPPSCSSAGWSSWVSNKDTVQGVGSSGSNCYSYSKLKTKNIVGYGRWSADFGYSFTNLSSVMFSIARETQCSFAVTNGNNFNVTLVKPDSTTVTLLSSTSFCTLGAGSTNDPWTTYTTSDWKNEFAQNGTYTIKINTRLATQNKAGASVDIHYDNVTLAFTAPTGMRYDVVFTTSSVPYPANNHYVEINYSVPVIDNETAKIYAWNGAGWVFLDTLANSPSSTLASPIFLSYSEYNGGSVRVKYEDEIVGDTVPSSLYIDYHRVC